MSSYVHRALRALGPAVGTLVLAGSAWPGLAVAQPALEAASEEQLRLVETIREERARAGFDSPGLIEPLGALALLYQEAGDAVSAFAAVEQARQVVRINYGLYSLEEAPLIRQSIYGAESRGDAAAAWDLEQELLGLVRRNADDLRTVPILREMARRRMDVLRRYTAGEFPPEITLGCYYDQPARDQPARDASRACYAGSRGRAKAALRDEALSYYAQAIRTITRNEGASDAVPELLMERARISYEYGGRDVGERSLRRLFSYLVEHERPHRAQTDALVQIADWELLHSRNGQALETYREAYEHMRQQDLPQAAIDGIFAPETPAVLPAFVPNPLASAAGAEPAAYVDVAFEVTKYGVSRKVEILDTTSAPDAAQADLVRLIKRSRFRPRITQGRRFDRARVLVRYYVSE